MTTKIFRTLATALALGAFSLMIQSQVSVHAQDNLKPWEAFDFATQPVKTADLNNLQLDDLKFLRGIVFGRHGRIFKDAAHGRKFVHSQFIAAERNAACHRHRRERADQLQESLQRSGSSSQKTPGQAAQRLRMAPQAPSPQRGSALLIAGSRRPRVRPRD